MNRLWKSVLLAGAAWSACAFTAAAQDTTGQEEATSVDEVVITARRREESLKDVPVAVSALSEERLERTGASDITALQQQTPNATVQIARGSNSTLISFIRGVGQQDPLWGFEPGVGLYIDDVYVARPQGAVLDIFDVQRIEVLRGPQGTLYGRNTIGGAIKYVTKRLGDEPSLTARAALGSYSQQDFLVSGSVPLGSDFAIGGAIAKYDRDGFGRNYTTGQDHYNKDVLAYRASAEFAPSENLFFRLAYDRVDDKSAPRHGHRELPGAGGNPPVLSSVYDTLSGLTGAQRVETEGLSLTGEFRVNDNLTLKSITANRKGDSPTVIDFDGSPAATLDIPAVYSDTQFSQEFQATWTGDRWQGVAGLYYLNASAQGAFDTIAGNLGLAIASAGKVNTSSISAYADISFDITERLKASVGGRWTSDDKDSRTFRAFYLGATRTPVLGGAPRAILQTRTNYAAETTFEKFTPRVSLSYDLNDDLTGYVSYSEGFKSGGWDMRGDAVATAQTVNGYDPETVKTGEVGLKGYGFNRRLSFASAFFYSAYEGQQVTTQVPLTPPQVGIASFVDNVGSSTIWGLEFEGAAFISDNLTANFSLGYLNAEFNEFLFYDIATGRYVDIANTREFQNAPKWSGYVGLTWRGDVRGGELAITPSVSYRSKYHLFDVADPILDQKAYALVDVSAVWSSPDQHWSLGLYGKNLTDERYRVGGYNFNVATYNNSVIGFYGPPRTFTAQLTYKY